MPFAHGPVLSYIGRGKYRTVGSTEYVGAVDRITIPDGFDTDLASVPRLFWWLLPPSGVYERAAVLHDYGCVQLRYEYGVRKLAGQMRDTKMYDPGDVEAVETSRLAQADSRDVDGLFRRVMRECGVGPVTRWVMWCGVRWGALANPARRAGWWRDAPAVLAITATVLAITGAAVHYLDRLIHLLRLSQET